MACSHAWAAFAVPCKSRVRANKLRLKSMACTCMSRDAVPREMACLVATTQLTNARILKRRRRVPDGNPPCRNRPASAAYSAAAATLSWVFVSKSLASCRSCNCSDGSPCIRLTIRPRFTAGRA
jgi:hypothetical protein